MQRLFEHNSTSKAAFPEGSCVFTSFPGSIPSLAHGHGSVRVLRRLATSPVKSLGRSVVDDIYRAVHLIVGRA